MNLTTLTSADLVKITNLLKAKESLLAKVAVIDQQLTAFESGGVVKTGPKISEAGKKRIAAAQKARWAKIKAEKAKKK